MQFSPAKEAWEVLCSHISSHNSTLATLRTIRQLSRRQLRPTVHHAGIPPSSFNYIDSACASIRVSSGLSFTVQDLKRFRAYTGNLTFTFRLSPCFGIYVPVQLTFTLEARKGGLSLSSTIL